VLFDDAPVDEPAPPRRPRPRLKLRRPARRSAPRPEAPPAPAEAPGLPLYVIPDINGPKVRLGVVWFAAIAAAAAWSRPGLAIVMALASALAADELVRIHLGRRRWSVLVAGAVLPLAALHGVEGLLTGAAGVCLLQPGAAPAVEELGVALIGPLMLGLAASSPVLVAGLGGWAALTMVVLISAYEIGDFTFGAGASARWEGPMAGIVAVAVCGFAAWVLDTAPLEQDGVVWMAATIGLLAPFGPPLGSVLLGSARQPGRYVRRIDTLLVAGPFAAFAVARIVHLV
jgi:hypothetical protein